MRRLASKRLHGDRARRIAVLPVLVKVRAEETVQRGIVSRRRGRELVDALHCVVLRAHWFASRFVGTRDRRVRAGYAVTTVNPPDSSSERRSTSRTDVTGFASVTPRDTSSHVRQRPMTRPMSWMQEYGTSASAPASHARISSV